MSDVSLLSGISGLSFDSILLSHLLFFYLLPLFFLSFLLLFFFSFFAGWLFFFFFLHKIRLYLFIYFFYQEICFFFVWLHFSSYRRWYLVGGMCSMLPYWYTPLCVHLSVLFLSFFLKSGIEKSYGSPRYTCMSWPYVLFKIFFYQWWYISDRLFLGKFVCDVCMFCFLTVSRLIL